MSLEGTTALLRRDWTALLAAENLGNGKPYLGKGGSVLAGDGGGFAPVYGPGVPVAAGQFAAWDGAGGVQAAPYTPVNRAGDTMTGLLTVPATGVRFQGSGTNRTITINAFGDMIQIPGANFNANTTISAALQFRTAQGLHLGSLTPIQWKDNADGAVGTVDTQLKRLAAGSAGVYAANGTTLGTWNAGAIRVTAITSAIGATIDAGTPANAGVYVLTSVDGFARSVLGLDSGTPFLGFGSGSAARDAFVYRGGPGILEQRNATNNQTLRVYSTTDGTNSEFASIEALGVSGVFFGSKNTGTGMKRSTALHGNIIFLNTGTTGFGTTAWYIDGTRHFKAGADNVHDIGTSGANRPRTLHLANGQSFRGAPSNPTTSDIAAGNSVVWNNTDLSETRLWANVGGDLKALTPLEALDVVYVDATPTYHYYGGLKASGDWKINRYDTTDYLLTEAMIADNGAYATLDAAWADRETLTYI